MLWMMGVDRDQGRQQQADESNGTNASPGVCEHPGTRLKLGDHTGASLGHGKDPDKWEHVALAGLYDETSQPDGLELGHVTEASLQKGRNNCDAQGKELELEELDKHYLEGLLQGGEAAEGPGHRVGPGQGQQSSDLLLQKIIVMHGDRN